MTDAKLISGPGAQFVLPRPRSLPACLGCLVSYRPLARAPRESSRRPPRARGLLSGLAATSSIVTYAGGLNWTSSTTI